MNSIKNLPKYKLIRSNRRTVSLQITPQAELIIRTSHKTAVNSIEKIIAKKMSWIIEKQNEMLKIYAHKKVKTFSEGEAFLFLGKEYPLEKTAGSYGTLLFDGNIFSLPESSFPMARWLFKDWYKQQALSIFARKVKNFAARLNATFLSIALSDATKRWGTCSINGKIRLNWRLIMAPEFCIDYVAAHEVSHLLEMNHSRTFWRTVKSLIPGYAQAKKWLQKNYFLLDF